MSNEEILTVEKETDHAIKLGKALIRLRENQDFKDLIEEGYLREKVLASVSLLAVPQIKAQNKRPDVMEDIVAASNLQYFFQMVDNAYIEATDPVYSDEEEAELNGK
jgi:uncharacterized protein (UPF0264 family)